MGIWVIVSEGWYNIQKPTWVIVDTWNDFTESYLSPANAAEMPECAWFYNVCPLLKSHAGYAELSRTHIQWYKTVYSPPPPRMRSTTFIARTRRTRTRRVRARGHSEEHREVWSCVR